MTDAKSNVTPVDVLAESNVTPVCMSRKWDDEEDEAAFRAVDLEDVRDYDLAVNP